MIQNVNVKASGAKNVSDHANTVLKNVSENSSGSKNVSKHANMVLIILQTVS